MTETTPLHWSPPDSDYCTPEQTVEVLRAISDCELSAESLFWNVDSKGVRFLINCNDFFVWACADAEPLTYADLPLLRDAYAELEAVAPGECFEVYALELYCCRRRGHRPQAPMYRHFDERLHALFDACGPQAGKGAATPHASSSGHSAPIGP